MQILSEHNYGAVGIAVGNYLWNAVSVCKHCTSLAVTTDVIKNTNDHNTMTLIACIDIHVM